jgi:hypothetical protein
VTSFILPWSRTTCVCAGTRTVACSHHGKTIKHHQRFNFKISSYFVGGPASCVVMDINCQIMTLDASPMHRPRFARVSTTFYRLQTMQAHHRVGHSGVDDNAARHSSCAIFASDITHKHVEHFLSGFNRQNESRNSSLD